MLIVTMQLPKAYEPHEYEPTVYSLWEETDAFTPQSGSHEDSFSIVVPPPNANGNLHLGHGLTLAIEDILVRYNRAKGKQALLLPGADHAGFETQVVYEKHLAKEGKSRFDFTRDQLYDQIYEFVAENRQNYRQQFRALGAGVDWSRYVFTLDEKIVRQAYNTFKKMWDDGLIYRGNRLVNFCTFHGTAFADIEVVYKEAKGSLWHIRYPLVDGSGEVMVATTRPETMLGDTAVAVHPEDPRYKKFVGKTVKLPLTNREIPILADEMVDREFGTGAVKITPAHDINDYEVAQRHDLPYITIIDHEGKLTSEVPEKYRGLTVVEARKAVVKDLDAEGALKKTEDIVHNVGHCYKCNTVIEPLLRDQWFIDMQPLVKPAIKAIRAGEITFYPESKKKQLVTYLEGLRDWNISRQIAWGIPIPAYQNIDDPDDWVYNEQIEHELLEIDGKTYRRDPDVFDTWFSSSSWPYATMDYPVGEDFKQFYPLSVMETGADILYPWVSRMIMFGLYTTGEVPFKNVYLHGLVLDQHGQKMSKSKGNVVDPIKKVQEFGSDAFRMGIIAGQTAGNNQPYDETKLVGARNFCNKLWNMARYIEGKLGDDKTVDSKPKPQTPADHWVLSKLQHSTEVMSGYLDDYRLSEAYEALYHLVWDDVADWYIEASKAATNPSMLAYVLQTVLQLAHPFAPFVTETIWQTLAWEKGSVLAKSTWPTVPAAKTEAVAEFEAVKDTVTELRALTKAVKTTDVELHYIDAPLLAKHAEIIKQLSRISDIVVVKEDEDGLRLVQAPFAAWLAIDHKTAQKAADDLHKQVETHKQVVKQLQGRLSNKSYVDNAPKAIVKQTQNQLAEAEQLLAATTEEYNRFKNL